MATILIVDGDENAHWLYRCLFEPERFRVLVAGTKEEAAEMAADSEIDLVIADSNVPGLSLMDHLALFCERDIPVIVRTADDDPPEDIPVWLPEAWLTKTSDSWHLTRAVAEALMKKKERETASLWAASPSLFSELDWWMFGAADN